MGIQNNLFRETITAESIQRNHKVATNIEVKFVGQYRTSTGRPFTFMGAGTLIGAPKKTSISLKLPYQNF